MVSSEAGAGDHRARLGGGAIASISGLALLLIFIVQNTDDVKLDFLFWDFTWPLWLLTIVSALLGAFVWFGFGVMHLNAALAGLGWAPPRYTTTAWEDAFVSRAVREAYRNEVG